MSTLRGKVLKVPDATPGLLFVNGQQKVFQIDGVWRSMSVAPAPNQTVDVELDESGAVLSIRPVSDSDLAREELMRAQRIAQEKSKALAATAVAKVGKPVLIATALLFAGWFFLDYFSLNIPFFGMGIKIHPTFWQGVGYIRAATDAMDNPLAAIARSSREYSTGIYGVLAVICLAGPLLPLIWKDKRAHLGAVLPLLFTLFLAVQCYRVIGAAEEMFHSPMSMTGYTPAQVAAAEAAAAAQVAQYYKELEFEMGFGFYLSTVAMLFLAGAGAKKYLALKASPEFVLEEYRG